AGDRPDQRRLELVRSGLVEHLEGEPGPRGVPRLCFYTLEGLVDVQRPGALEAGPELGAELRVLLQARVGQLADGCRPCLRMARGEREPRQPGQHARPRTEVEGAVALPHPAQSVAQRGRVRYRIRVARADQPG